MLRNSECLARFAESVGRIIPFVTLGVDIACRELLSRFNGLPRQCRFGKPLKTALTGPYLMCTGLKDGINNIGQLPKHFTIEIWIGILELRFRALTPCPDRRA